MWNLSVSCFDFETDGITPFYLIDNVHKMRSLGQSFLEGIQAGEFVFLAIEG